MADETEIEDEKERNMGTQPLDAILLQHALANHDLVEACKDPLTHKAVARARKGRRLTKNTQQRVLTALNVVLKAKGVEQPLKLLEVFSYKA
jgi:hypothetical protein